MASGERLTLGQPFFPRPASGDSAGGAGGVSVSDGDSPGVGVGDVFLRFDLLFGVGDGVGEAFFGFAEAVGDGVGVGFFVECFRCLRLGVGLGSGSKTFLLFEPNDSSAALVPSVTPKNSAESRSSPTNLTAAAAPKAA